MTTAGALDFYFDFTSPYTYLAWTRIGDLGRRTGVEVRLRPAFLGAIHKETGNLAPALLPARGRYMLHDLFRWAAWYGVPFRWPDSFPLRSLPGLRVAAALLDTDPARGAAFVDAVFRAAWGDSRDIGDPAVLSALAAEAGFPGTDAEAVASDPRWKDAVRAGTDAAVAAGAYGLPVMVYEGEMYFGNDRLGLLEERIRRGVPWPTP